MVTGTPSKYIPLSLSDEQTDVSQREAGVEIFQGSVMKPNLRNLPPSLLAPPHLICLILHLLILHLILHLFISLPFLFLCSSHISEENWYTMVWCNKMGVSLVTVISKAVCLRCQQVFQESDAEREEMIEPASWQHYKLFRVKTEEKALMVQVVSRP